MRSSLLLFATYLFWLKMCSNELQIKYRYVWLGVIKKFDRQKKINFCICMSVIILFSYHKHLEY